MKKARRAGQCRSVVVYAATCFVRIFAELRLLSGSSREREAEDEEQAGCG